ncbi:hypothetical protein PILCRDRAFT_820526 [Piloderma croceum F 1598]|uniref:Uncharacterized protein n=1 Tax=Piloderma croceum (strain F 1598) TaxID=765440 RepID=A0A0C3BXU1_PILCF|nr:hypothetical protein PILCRDRAFT_820526 [Piloderma croceum F 1598]
MTPWSREWIWTTRRMLSMQIGQAMRAIVHSLRVEPKPLRNGFVVDSTWFTSFKQCNYAEHRAVYMTVSAMDMSRYFKLFEPTLGTSQA